jgi:4-hydroxy-2-oxoheptanedioate aldolase
MSNLSMRPSKILAKLRRGQIVNSIKLNLADPRAVEIAGLCGADSVWLDVEHCPNTLHDIENQVRAAKAYDMDAIVRVERGSYSDLVRPLEMDAAGIMVPHVLTAEDAQLIAQRTRFHPVGRRPMDGGNADGAYCGIPVEQYIEQANRERLVIVQIEDPEAMEELDDIAQVDGIDLLFFGPGDYSHALGVPGQANHPDVQEGFLRVAEACRKHGKFAGAPAPLDGIPRLVEMGFHFVSSGADVLALMDSFGQIVRAYNGLEQKQG